MQIERFIHTSTVSIYGRNAGRDTDEESSLPQSDEPYGDTKLQAEMIIRGLVQDKELPAVIVQPSQVYGPGDKTWTLRPLQLIQSGKMILPDGGNGLIHPIYIDDLVDGILATDRRGRTGEAYILCGPEVVTIREFFGHLATIVGKNRLPSVPGWLAVSIATTAELVAKITRRPPVFTRNTVRFVTGHTSFNGSKASRELGFCPTTTLETGMRAVEDRLRREGHLA
jgi:dihydroflavonol-4-reductase